MDRSLLLLCAGVFATFVVAALGLYRMLGDNEARRLRRRLKEITAESPESDEPQQNILRDSRYSSIPFLDALLHRMPVANALALLLLRAKVSMSVGTFILLTAVLAAAPVAVGATVLHLSLPIASLGVSFGTIPVLWLRQRKARRVRAFERQFPDALDILTSALRAGMAFSGAVQVVAEECAEDVASEFTLLFEENRLGVDMRTALRNLAIRVDSKELHLFVIAVLLQRDTGGNLIEILEGTAEVIRDRLRILGDIRALTAQARMSGMILSALPVAVGTFILFTAPDYMRILVHEQVGKNLLFAAIVLQVIGYVIMRRIATIKV